ncbi:MAG TPA: primosomal protein N' [Caldimonas sp.]|jgi:primosomal protein N' (replication factor Y)|nr:primosomal protein N' [Caldimonas sp.]HEV7578443.1 primosomal protein N' [Caldimonas sp.]
MADADAIVRVLVDAPRHAGLTPTLSYRSQRPLDAGMLVRVPFGRREVAGLTWTAPASDDPPPELREIAEICDALPPLGAHWCALVEFAAAYYQRSVGEIALAVLPPELRRLGRDAVADRIRRLQRAFATAAKEAAPAPGPDREPALTADQAAATTAIAAALGTAVPGTTLLHGVTGSGKTEVYLRAAAQALAAGRQALVLVPEINLTPQLIDRFTRRFAGRRIVALHSGLTPAQRLRSWLAAQLGLADLVLGTRLAVFAPLPRLGLVVVDEEHDASYKQQEGARYSARDLAVWRGRREGVLVVLGSATPSLESWQRAETGRYTRLALPERIGGAAWPAIRLVDMGRLPKATVGLRASAPPPALAPQIVAALHQRIARGEQSLVFLNRRGYAPVLQCGECGWLSGCPHCSAWRVFHKQDRTLRCHHCGLAQAVPRACPDCGNPDIAPVGRGTERLEEQLAALLPEARIARIDADSTRKKGSLEATLGAVHAGEVDILVGTQMVAKGHDFRRIGLVAAVNPDTSLFSSDFRAPERLFALLMQAAGRAGRDAASGTASEMWLQTWHPTHPLYQALARHDYAAFAAGQLEERASAGLPPFSHLAVLRADAKTVEAARAFLVAAAAAARLLDASADVMIYAPVPLDVARVADIERMQMLVESASRQRLQALLHAWLPHLDALHLARGDAQQRVLRWAIDVDPLTI